MPSAQPPTTAAPDDAPLPRPFGRLWLLRLLARGGMGEVFLASTTGIEGAERPCVVKIIRREHAKDASFLARFLDEARVQAQLQHPGVAQILEASHDGAGEPYVVVEHVEGRSLSEVRARATSLGVRLSWPDAVAIATALAEGLAHVHERRDHDGKPLGIVHRDLSPQNVMVGYGGDLKLIDFGTARGENRRCHTIAGVVFAKPGYVAPEVANGDPGDHRVDLYALGIMLWELLAGRRFLQGDAQEHLGAVAKDQRRPPPIAGLIGAPAALDAIVAKLVAHERDARYASARLAASELAKVLASSPSLPNGERGVRARIAQLMYTLHPSEPSRSRAEFQALVEATRRLRGASSGTAAAAAPRAAAETDASLLPGTRYRILRKLGEGAMGVVYEAEHVELARKVALKVLAPEHATSTVYNQRFRREARAIARLSHPNLVTLHDFGQASDGRLFCAMELLEGETLEQKLAHDSRFDWRRALRLGVQACRALDAAHAAGVVHRDLKPANLFLTRAGGLKLLDFGVAKAPGEAHDGAEAEGKERSLSLFGTPEYMAPEQVGGGEVDRRADLYALGCVLYELCTGGLPFAASSPVAILEQKGRAMPEAPSARAPEQELPRGLDAVILRALATHPDGRYASAAEMGAALERVLSAKATTGGRSRLVGWAGLAALTSVGALFLVARGAYGRLPSAHALEAPIAAVVVSEPAPAPVPVPAPAPELATPTAIATSTSTSTSTSTEAAPGEILAARRKLANERRNDASALRAWAEAAAAAGELDEARRAAEAWRFVDAGAAPRLFVARVLAAGGRKLGALSVLNELLDDHPESDEARALLRELAGSDAARVKRHKTRVADNGR